MERKTDLDKDIEKVLVSAEEIEAITEKIADQIDHDYRGSGKKLLLLGILKGSVVFMGELMKKMTLPVEIDFMKVSSYGAGVETSGFIEVSLDLKRDIKDVDVIIVEDIIDSGRTLQKLCSLLENRGAHSVKCCTLLDKPSRRQVEMVADYTGIIIPDEFVVGYGLDFAEYYRNLPYIGVLDPSVYSE
jgi:hypoxanthine phosphoribosyltransferase